MALVILLSFLSTGCYSQNKDNKEKAPDPFVWDFGRVKEGDVLKHNFILQNTSEAILNIKDITTSCGCTVSQVKKKTLLPGESTFIEVQFNSKGYSGSTQQFVYVHTDSLDRPVIRYRIKAEVKFRQRFTFTPFRKSLSEFDPAPFTYSRIFKVAIFKK